MLIKYSCQQTWAWAGVLDFKHRVLLLSPVDHRKRANSPLSHCGLGRRAKFSKLRLSQKQAEGPLSFMVKGSLHSLWAPPPPRYEMESWDSLYKSCSEL